MVRGRCGSVTGPVCLGLHLLSISTSPAQHQRSGNLKCTLVWGKSLYSQTQNLKKTGFRQISSSSQISATNTSPGPTCQPGDDLITLTLTAPLLPPTKVVVASQVHPNARHCCNISLWQGGFAKQLRLLTSLSPLAVKTSEKLCL